MEYGSSQNAVNTPPPTHMNTYVHAWTPAHAHTLALEVCSAPKTQIHYIVLNTLISPPSNPRFLPKSIFLVSVMVNASKNTNKII